MLMYTKGASKIDVAFRKRTVERKYHKTPDFPNDWGGELTDLTTQTHNL